MQDTNANAAAEDAIEALRAALRRMIENALYPAGIDAAETETPNRKD
jgi:hypothetical protein